MGAHYNRNVDEYTLMKNNYVCINLIQTVVQILQVKSKTGKVLSTTQGKKVMGGNVFNGQEVRFIQHSHQIFSIPKVTRKDNATLQSTTNINKVISQTQELNLQDEMFHTRIKKNWQGAGFEYFCSCYSSSC